jgi:hypothetical protein
MTSAAARYLHTVWSELSGPKVVFAVIALTVMANLSAVIDVFTHPEIPYFDHEHLDSRRDHRIVNCCSLSDTDAFYRKSSRQRKKYEVPI